MPRVLPGVALLQMQEVWNLVNDKAFLSLNDGTHTFRSNSYGSADVLDLTFICPGLFPCSSWRVLDNIGSDHLPILIEIDLKSQSY
ncbi:RNA-directed DNA polymerase from mobile element jockey [Trichonephila inaurata madagascariensis]|uniref:RNA-directed DNA polymerase from mobile element jockey n=1 Tax=Trichonephila inaurata madagascariensis TaxID=2747483 RepID=A0A8X6X7E0_9ARAC|nr:RNA-directed DNA polymerase from mobile element jockey [Trichonephila inaurata madagascariensis]GFY48144.1 RNA-directed DNA polymerase from mobile element jockey [Trichonephila inaurata madagascariensis]